MKSLVLYLIIIMFGIISAFSIQYLFIEDYLYYQTFGEQITSDQITKMLQISKKYYWLGYVFVPIIILIRVISTSIFLYIGVFFTNLKIEFSKLFKVALLADFIFVLSGLAKLIILIFFKEVSTLEDLQFTPLSVMEFLDYGKVDPLFIYPLSLLNVFELLYFLVLAWLLVSAINEANQERSVNFGKSLKLVTASYGSGLLLWVVFVMFISLNLT
ncbi:MAG: hypothetical protein ACOCWM_04810 [Cyclobacteriaceae bacterium]